MRVHRDVDGASPGLPTVPGMTLTRLTTLLAALALALAPSPTSAAPPAALPAALPAGPGTSYELLQLNLCLSGYAGCFDDTDYPAVVDEAIALTEEEAPDAVTVNEACSGDVARIAAETGYDYRFTTVIYRGAPLDCKDPGSRGVFGNAVLVDGTITGSDEAAYDAQLGSEERRWLCVDTAKGPRVCSTHLSVAGSDAQRATNQAQCEEVRALLTPDGRPQPVLLGGDVNRQDSCAPDGFWTLTDGAAAQAPGIQHVHGARAWFRQPESTVVPMTYTDHDALLATAVLR